MYKLFEFLYSIRVFLAFLVLEGFCLWLVVANNPFQRMAFFRSANAVSGHVYSLYDGVEDYFQLREDNRQLAQENRRLQEQVANLRTDLRNMKAERPPKDSLPYQVIGARVLRNTFTHRHNFATFNKGNADGVEPGLGVISGHGVVGKVLSASSHFSQAFTLLHPDIQISSEIKRLDATGSVAWEKSYGAAHAKLEHVARHLHPKVGDSVFTEHSSIFPPGVPVGVIEEVNLDENSTFYDIKLRLATDFSRLENVYIIRNLNAAEQDSLESQNPKTAPLPDAE